MKHSALAKGLILLATMLTSIVLVHYCAVWLEWTSLMHPPGPMPFASKRWRSNPGGFVRYRMALSLWRDGSLTGMAAPEVLHLLGHCDQVGYPNPALEYTTRRSYGTLGTCNFRVFIEDGIVSNVDFECECPQSSWYVYRWQPWINPAMLPQQILIDLQVFTSMLATT